MAFRTQKISQMTPKGANLEATDLIEVSTIESGSYVTRSITGQEIIDAAVGNVDWGDIGGTLSAQTDLQSALDAKVPTSRTLTINGVTQDLSANRTFTISTGITIGSTAIASGVVGRVLFEGAGNVVQESSSLFWDSTNNRLGIGTSTPSDTLSVNGNLTLLNLLGTNRSTQLSTSGSSDNLPSISFYPATGTNVGQSFDIIPKGTGYSSGIKTQFGIWGTDFIANQTNYELLLVRATGSSYTFESFKGGTGAHRPILLSAGVSNQLWAYTSGNIGINTTTDAGFRLDVNGTARVTGSATIQTLTVGLGAGSQSNNTVLGLSAFSSNTSGNFNVAIGPSALFNHTTGTGNIGIGHFAAVQISNGANNVAIGREALSNGNSSGNVVVGMQACNTTTGNNNVVLGLQAQAGNFSNSIVIGNSAIGAGNNSVVLGNDSITTTVLKGNVGIGTSSPTQALDIFSGNLTLRSSSSPSINIGTGGFPTLRLNNRTAIQEEGSTIMSIGRAYSAVLFFSSNTEVARFNGGNLLINTTTDAGFRLDVNGTARVQGPTGYSMVYDSSGVLNSYGAYNALKMYNSATLLCVNLGSEGSNGRLELGQNGSSYIRLNGGASANDNYIKGATLIGANYSSANSSSVLECRSTTQGFLPPRMTTTQKNAIATPAAGLVVYDTTLNKLCVYTTAWETVTSL